MAPAQEGGQIPAGAKCRGVLDAGGECGCGEDAHPRDGFQPLAGFIGPVPGDQLALECADPLAKAFQLGGEYLQDRAQQLGQPGHRLIFVQALQGIQGVARSRSDDDPELGQLRPRGIEQHGPLPHQQVAGAMQGHDRLRASERIGTKRMFGRDTASQIASASAASFFCRFT